MHERLLTQLKALGVAEVFGPGTPLETAVRFIRDTPDLDGPVNLAAPRTSDNRTLMATLRRVVGAPFGLPAARFMLEPAMWALRTEPELLLKSRWVVPTRLTQAGFSFAHPDLEPALRDALRLRGPRLRERR